MIIRNLLTKLGFKVDEAGFKKGINAANAVKTAVIGIAATAAAASAAIFGLAKSTADYGDSVAKTSDKLGIGIEALQELRFAASQTGVATQSFDIAMQRLTRRTAEFAETGGGSAAPAFKKLGIAVTDLNGNVKPTEQLIGEIADEFQKLTSDADRVKIAFNLFDTEGVNLTNTLRIGSAGINRLRTEARGLGFVMSEEGVRSAEVFTDELEKFNKVILGIRNEIGSELIPIVQGVLKTFRAWIKENRTLIKTKITVFFKTAVKFLGAMFKTVKKGIGIFRSFVNIMIEAKEAIAIAAATALLMASPKILRAFGTFARVVGKGITKAFSKAGRAALLANIKFLLIPIAIGLIGQDIIAFAKGDDSVLGLLILGFSVLGKAIALALKPATDFIRREFNNLQIFFETFMEDVQFRVAALQKFLSTVSDLSIRELLKTKNREALQQALSGVTGGISEQRRIEIRQENQIVINNEGGGGLEGLAGATIEALRKTNNELHDLILPEAKAVGLPAK